jgi:hypothetical protein
VDDGGTESKGGSMDKGSGTENWGMDDWGNLGNGVDKSILVEILRESFQIDGSKTAWSCDQVSKSRGDWAGNLGSSHGSWDEGSDDDLKF